MLESYLKQLELGFFEVTEAFRGLADENVWKRPGPRLLSVGELAGHIAYWEALRFGGSKEDGSSARDLSTCNVSSPLLDERFGYYTTNVETSPKEEQLALTAAQVEQELLRIHRECVELLKARNPDLDAQAPFWSPQSNYRDLLAYMAFHVAYHTGQMYCVRHLLGETTPDN